VNESQVVPLVGRASGSPSRLAGSPHETTSDQAHGRNAERPAQALPGAVLLVREELPVKEAIPDGEVVALDAEGRQNFRDLISGRGNLHYPAFDALWINGKNLR
jgi:ATP-dependent DNA ligase